MFHLVKKIGSLGLSALFRIPSLINRESSTARFISLFPLMVLTIGFVLSWHHSNHASATFDENIHIAEGLTFLSGHGYLTAIDHPPLFGILLALPTWLEHSPEVPAPEKTDYPFIGFAHRVVWQNQMDGRQAIVSARRVNLCFTVLLGCLLVLVAQRMHGPFGATITATVFAFSPIVIAHGSLATTDLSHALMTFAFLEALRIFEVRRSVGWLLMAGSALGIALMVKHIAVLLVPLCLVHLTVFEALRIGRKPIRAEFSKSAGTILTAWISILAIAGLVVFSVYGWSFGVPNEWSFPTPAPEYIDALSTRFETAKLGRQFYLNGEISTQGWLIYPVIAVLYKTPLAMLVLAAMAVARWLRHRRGISLALVPTALVLLLWFVAIVVSRMNLGIRYLLPLYPFMFVALGYLGRDRRMWFRVLVAILLIVFSAGAFVRHPNHLACFNELIPEDARRFLLVDSNLDWGQGLTDLADYQREHHIERLYLGYFGTAPASAYGVQATLLPSFLNFDTS